ncbi:MAG: N-6 DNA methylase [Bacteroidia bacterium]|nr:N-6 DNA methylase [Bacteroidia bacterium]
MASFNYKEVEQKLQKLKEITNPEEIGYRLLSAFGTSDTYINRYKSGKGNFAKNGGILLKKGLAFQAVPTLMLTETLEAMKTDDDITKQKARLLVVSDGKTVLGYDPKFDESYENSIEKLWLDFHFFTPLSPGSDKNIIIKENPADVKAAEKMAKLHNEIRRYNEYASDADLHDLNVFMTRLLFCFFAEDTGIFEQGIFTDFIRNYTLDDGSNLSEALDEAFNVMDEPLRVGKTRMFAQFPYVNGGLFHSRISIPKMGMRARRILLECSELNWGDINPDIFGSMMQAVVTPELRGGLGMHYTSVPNIMKVIQPLFLDELEEAFITASDSPKKLDALLIRISKIKFFDPACGSGNFLIITYKELRRLEIRIWLRIAELTGLRILPFTNISISQFYGIEIDSFAHELAMLSLWLAEHQMNAEFTRKFSEVKIDALPLKNIVTIVQGNACRVDWNEVCPHTADEEVYVFGNPPYLGARLQSELQKEDIAFALSDIKGFNNLDYISIWFYLGAKYIEKSNAKYAFVSTNSICQGEQVGILWHPIFDLGLEINFAHLSFKWTNNAKYNAGVTCVVIGVSTISKNKKRLYSENKVEIVDVINAYLTKGSNTIVKARSKSISKFPVLSFGSMPNDGGALLLDRYEKDELLNAHPEASVFIKKFLGSQEFIRGEERYCLWIEDANQQLANSIEPIVKRIDKVYNSRVESKRKPTQALAQFPYRFGEIRYKPTDAIIIPRVSSERREYIPIGFLDKNIVVSDSAFALYDAEMWLFGILTSKIHNAWVRAVGGRLKTDMRYSASLCYNTFPFPKLSEAKKKEIEALAEEVLMVRENHTEKTLAEMYDPDKMPQDLREAHHTLDLAVDSCYPSAPFASDEERLEVLFKMYEKM